MDDMDLLMIKKNFENQKFADAFDDLIKSKDNKLLNNEINIKEEKKEED